jgi:O-antigen ligase
VLAVAAVAALGLAVLNASTIDREVRERWTTMKAGDTGVPTGPRLGAEISDQRYDYWRVSLDLFREAPVGGVGAGNFEPRYLAAREGPSPSRYPHDIWLRFLGENGAVGFALFVGLLAVALAAPLVAWRRLDRTTQGVIAACSAMTCYFLTQATVDWIDRLPVIAGPALAVPFIALRLAGSGRTRASASPVRRRAVYGVAAIGLVALVASLVAPYLAVRYEHRALATWRTDSAAAFRDFDRARAANPLEVKPLLSKGTTALALKRDDVARDAFRAALRVEDHWYPHFELALMEAQAGRFRSARREIRRAGLLNAHDAVVADARDQIAARRRLDPMEINRKILSQTLFTRDRLV